MDEYKTEYDKKWDEHKRTSAANESYQDGSKNGGGCVVLIVAVGATSTFLSCGLFYLMS